MPLIEFSRVSVAYNDVFAVKDLSFSLEEGEITVLAGPSGSGKSTTIRLVNRLIEPTSGSIFFKNRDLKTFVPEQLRRTMGYSIQGVGLFPHWTVIQNISAVPKLLKWNKNDSLKRARELLDLVGLDPLNYAQKYPDELSGGEAQRVGIARALAADPPLLLMDEPFGALDVVKRKALQQTLLEIQKNIRKTILLVTHDLEEAILLADKILLLNNGQREQWGTPEELLNQPDNDFVKNFFGQDLAYRRLIRYHARDILEKVLPNELPPQECIAPTTTLREALALMLSRNTEYLWVKEETILGRIQKKAIERLASEGKPG